MRDRKLTGPWAGFSFKGGRLVTPEGRELDPHHLAWLSLTAGIAREWSTMMDETRAERLRRRNLTEKPCGSRRSRKTVDMATRDADVLYLRDYLRRTYEQQLSRGDPDPVAEPARADPRKRG